MPKAPPLRRLLKSTERHRQQVILAVICSILNKIFDLAPPVLIGIAVDVVVEREQSFLGRMGYEDPFSQLLILGVLTVVIWGLESVFEYLWQVLWRKTKISSFGPAVGLRAGSESTPCCCATSGTRCAARC